MKKGMCIFLMFLTFLGLSSCKDSKPNTPTPKEFEIIYHVNSDNSATIKKTYEENFSITKEVIAEAVNNPTKTGFTSSNQWYFDDQYSQEISFPYTVTENKDFYLKWEKNPEKYKVRYFVEDQLYKETIEYENQLPTKPNEPEPKGLLSFEGWYVDKEFTTPFDFLSFVDKDLDLYAKFVFDEKLIREDIKTNLNQDSYVKNKITDFSQYENTEAYRKVSTPEELIQAIADAKYHYKNVWDDTTKTYSQVCADGYDQTNYKGSVHVIEITKDMNLGYNKLSSAIKQTGLVDDFAKKMNNLKDYVPMSDMLLENGVSQIKVENTSDLLIYSKTGVKLTHCGFKLTSDNNVVFRNLEFDELWQWEDGLVPSANKIGDYDVFGWAYFKIGFCGYIWIDHCTFGKSYDGQIDYANPVYNANAAVAFRAPYGADGSNGLHVSWCKFNAGSDDKDGYLYQMMDKIEKQYQEGNSKYLYYNTLRDGGVTFEEILYGLAIPQKKGFLFGDTGNNKEDYDYNLSLQASFSNCIFKNIEDRLPKLRGGNLYMYNCVVDSSEYYEARIQLLQKNAAALVKSVNSGWKCALVSQGILCGNGGSIKAESCIFRGIDTILKNNDSNPSPKVDGGYQIINCSYQKNQNLDPTNIFTSSTATLKEQNFKWHTKDGTAPFTASSYSLEELEEILANTYYGAGVIQIEGLNLLKNVYE